jgi:hypothetical protein
LPLADDTLKFRHFHYFDIAFAVFSFHFSLLFVQAFGEAISAAMKRLPARLMLPGWLSYCSVISQRRLLIAMTLVSPYSPALIAFAIVLSYSFRFSPFSRFHFLQTLFSHYFIFAIFICFH